MTKNPLLQFAGVPVTGVDLKSCYPQLSSPEKKILAMEQRGELIRLKRNLYIVSDELCGRVTLPALCANHLYGPSYVSLQWALRYYGMIPERVYLMTSVTVKRSRCFDTPIGSFSYMQVPFNYFPIGVETVQEDGVCFLMASREKALCDTILHDRFVPSQSVKSLLVYLEEDMRLDMDILTELNVEIINTLADAGRKTQVLHNLIKIIRQ